MSSGICLGLDTSNYTTSAACFDGETGRQAARLLEVAPGALGLRQSEALFQHVKRLPGLLESLREDGALERPVSVVGASTKPRWVEGSYMPCFLAGESVGRSIAASLGVPFFACSHQQGHIAAAAWASGRIDLLDRPCLAWHLSGGTTELLLVEPEAGNVRAVKLGGTSDLSAGQLIDRTGVALGLSFPAGKGVDALAAESGEGAHFRVKLDGLTFSLSGVENQVKGLLHRGAPPQDAARYALLTVIDAVERATERALEQHPGLPVLFSGGVSSNALLRTMAGRRFGAVFAPPVYSTDNAMGVAVLACRALAGGRL